MWQPFRTGLVLGSLALSASILPAQSLPPTSPSELIRGLREQGLSDLALEYIAENSNGWSADLKKEVALERAKCRLELASTEVDDGNRELQISTAKQEFQEFLAASPNHPRASEAAVSLARLLTLEGKGELQKAKRITDETEKKKTAAASRELFTRASSQYGKAAAGLETLLNQANLADSRKRELTRDYYQALLDEAINYVQLAESYIKPVGKEIDDRDKNARLAQKLFLKLAEKDPAHPAGWVAKAWNAECNLILDDRGSYESEMKKLLEEGRKITAPAGAAAGIRMARFFQLRELFVLFVKGNDPSSRSNTINACRQWLFDYPSSTPTPETFATMYYLGTVLLGEGLKRDNLVIERGKPEKPTDPVPEKIVGVRPDGLSRLREADVFFRQIVAVDNDYKDRATRQRAKAIRYLVGNPDRPATAFANFDELYMAALLQIDKAAGGGETPASDADRKVAINKAVEFLEAARVMPVPRESARDAQQAVVTLAQTYTSANRPHEGAILAESLCRAAKSPGSIAKLGATALYAYEKASELIAGDNAEARAADRERMIALCDSVIKRAPNEATTSDIRLTQALLFSQTSSVKPMFDTLARIPNTYNRLALARLLQGVAAYEMVRSRRADETVGEPLTKEQKADILKVALRDMSAVPAVTKLSNKTEALDYFRLRLQLAQLHLTDNNAGLVLAEKISKEAAEAVKAFPDLPDEEKKKLVLRCEGIRTRAVYARAMPLLIDRKYKECGDILAPMMAEIVKSGPATKPELTGDVADLAKGLDADRIKLILVPLLQARLQEGAVEQTVVLLDQLKTFGGNLLVTARVVQQGVASVRPIVDSLRGEGKVDEANKLVASVGNLVNKLAAEKDLPNEVLLNLGRSFRDLGELGKAVELFERIPTPADKGYLSGEAKDPVIAETATPEERKKLETAHDVGKLHGSVSRQTKLELLRAYRATGDFAKADAILEDALGKEAITNKILERNGGWAGKLFDFRREYHYLLEAKGNAGKTINDANRYFVQAMALWKIRVDAYKAKLDGINKQLGEPRQLLEKMTKEGKSGEELAMVSQQIRAIEKEMENVKPLWHDMIIERLKVLYSAYLFESKSKPDGLKANMGKIASQIVQLEKANTFTETNTTRLLELINSNPTLAKAYGDAGGLLNKPKAPAAPTETPNK